MLESVVRRLIVVGLIVIVAACNGSPPTTAPSASSAPSSPPSAGATASPSSAGPTASLAPSSLPSSAASQPPSVAPTTSSGPTLNPGGPSGATGTVQVAAGGGTGTSLLQHPNGLAVAAGPVIWVSDENATSVRVFRNGVAGTVTGSVVDPSGLAVNSAGDLYIADPGSYRVVVAKHTGGIVVVAGSAKIGSGSTGDGGLATKALLSHPVGLAVDAAGNLYISDAASGRIRRVDAKTHKISTVAGAGGEGFSGDGGPAIKAKLDVPKGVAVTGDGSTLYIADTGNAHVRAVNLATGIITTIAGTTGYAKYDPSLTALQTPLSRLDAIAVDGAGMIYVPAFYNDIGVVVVRIDPTTGSVTPLFGGGNATSFGGPATGFSLNDVAALAIDPAAGNLYVASAQGLVYEVPGVAAPNVTR